MVSRSCILGPSFVYFRATRRINSYVPSPLNSPAAARRLTQKLGNHLTPTSMRKKRSSPPHEAAQQPEQPSPQKPQSASSPSSEWNSNKSLSPRNLERLAASSSKFEASSRQPHKIHVSPSGNEFTSETGGRRVDPNSTSAISDGYFCPLYLKYLHLKKSRRSGAEKNIWMARM